MPVIATKTGSPQEIAEEMRAVAAVIEAMPKVARIKIEIVTTVFTEEESYEKN